MAYNLEHIDPEERIELYADPRAPEEVRLSWRLLRIAGALAVMGVFAGGLWFAYTEGLRHTGGSASIGEVPLVRADTSPIKVKPKNPGGMPIPDRDMLIYGQQQPQVEHLLPPPELPMARPMPPPPAPPPEPARNAATPSAASTPQQATSRPTPQQPASAPSQEATTRPGSQPLSTPREQTLSGASPPSPGTTASAQLQTPGAAATRAAAPLRAASETGSLAAQPTADIIGQKIEQLEAAEAANRGKRSETGRGARVRLQLGAMRSESEARGTWERLRRKNTDLLGNFSAVAVRADLGGKGVYYRIETGPISDPTTADRVCGELRQRHLACMIVR